eukprot:CAMPEP_0119540336 /NCGR_PEP_ID=MMETSP1344-20130328/52261_1 /TAXON_ID=236787 /ORGANISM="Florenciella parvula, Strain CCMP2471" /LENGTH=42 /DNA_ID= /DNA_START= /DNA_END= /DNA_ORIENTATION=
MVIMLPRALATLVYLVLVDALQNSRVKVAEDARAVGHKEVTP